MRNGDDTPKRDASRLTFPVVSRRWGGWANMTSQAVAMAPVAIERASPRRGWATL